LERENKTDNRNAEKKRKLKNQKLKKRVPLNRIHHNKK
jgi:hypothetical protein